MKYKTEKEILGVIENFEKCEIERGTWGHPEHLIVAFHYAKNNDFETAYKKMRAGIFNLLRSFEIDLTKEMPYHETLTVFWMRTVFDFAEKTNNKNLFENMAEIIENFDKNYPLKFYSEELLFSSKARKEFVEPDLIKAPNKNCR